jgi:hypothetical protein
VLQFGAKIIEAQKGAAIKFQLVEFPCNVEGCSGRDDLEDLGGTRHQSAARLAALRPDVMILVVSQDGRASLMAQTGNTKVVRILRGFERALPPETTLRFGSYVRVSGTARGRSIVSGVSSTLSSKESNPE